VSVFSDIIKTSVLSRSQLNSKCQDVSVKTSVQPITLGVIFSKAQSSKLERLFCHVSVKRDFRAWSFKLFQTAFENVTPSGIGCTCECQD